MVDQEPHPNPARHIPHRPDHTSVLLIDDTLTTFVRNRGQVCTWGPRPTLADSEVLTSEVVGDLLGIETDAGLYHHLGLETSVWTEPARSLSTALTGLSEQGLLNPHILGAKDLLCPRP